MNGEYGCHRPANDAEDAYRVGESRSNYSSVVRRGQTVKPSVSVADGCMSFQTATKYNAPHLAAGAGGALVSLPRLDGSGTPRECVLRVHPLHQLSVSGANLARFGSSYLRAECPSSLHVSRRRPARTSARAPGRSPAVACDRVGNGGMLSSRRNESVYE